MSGSGTAPAGGVRIVLKYTGRNHMEKECDSMAMGRRAVLLTGTVVATLWILIILFLPARAAVLEHYQYVREESGKQIPVKWLLEKEDGYTLNYHTSRIKAVTETDHDFATLRWHCENAAEGTDIRAERQGNTIHLKGMLEGKSVDRVMRIDDSPWYQATTLSLRAFVLSAQERAEFWVLRPGSLKPYKLVATKEWVENRDVLGTSVPVQKVKISPGGMLAALWSCQYWFKKDDGMLIKCETPTGPPGSPDVVIRLTGIVR
ncbi:MAG: hypothetical protein SWH68_00320 [Thermodesulfobacteriota bacterium]|nr:hypothetical protein [Thermodesulfobacteriota bacterium]